MAAMKMMMAVAGTVLNVIRSQLERKRVEIGIVTVNRAKKKFSTETGFERDKTAEISKVHRLIIVTNALERWGIPF